MIPNHDRGSSQNRHANMFNTKNLSRNHRIHLPRAGTTRIANSFWIGSRLNPRLMVASLVLLILPCGGCLHHDVSLRPHPTPCCWQVVDPAGRKLGTVSQKNSIPQGSLNGAWGKTADAAASAASQGIIKLLPKTK